MKIIVKKITGTSKTTKDQEGKQIRCPDCNKFIGILKKDLLEIKCSRCGAVLHWDPKLKRLNKIKAGR